MCKLLTHFLFKSGETWTVLQIQIQIVTVVEVDLQLIVHLVVTMSMSKNNLTPNQ